MQDLLNRLGWSQVHFAHHIGASLFTVNRWCRHQPNTLPFRIAMLYLSLTARILNK